MEYVAIGFVVLTVAMNHWYSITKYHYRMALGKSELYRVIHSSEKCTRSRKDFQIYTVYLKHKRQNERVKRIRNIFFAIAVAILYQQLILFIDKG